MKKTVILVLISILFQSCFSYNRVLDFKAGAVIEKQGVKIYKNNGTELKGKVLSVGDNQITIISSKTKQVLKIPVKDILGVQLKQFSARKSIGIPAAAIITTILIYAVFGEQPSSSGDNQ